VQYTIRSVLSWLCLVLVDLGEVADQSMRPIAIVSSMKPKYLKSLVV
jgi:hypothetical protein